MNKQILYQELSASSEAETMTLSEILQDSLYIFGELVYILESQR